MSFGSSVRRRAGLIAAFISSLLLALVTLPGTASAAVGAAAAADDRAGLRGDYFAVTDHQAFTLAPENLKITVVDPQIESNNLVPIYQQLTGSGEWAGVRWTGRITAPATGDYTFSAIGDNGFRLWVGPDAVAGSAETNLIDFWVDQWDLEQVATRTVHLEAGTPTPIRFDLFQAVGGANIHLRWESADAGVTKEIVPASAFTLPADFTPYEVSATIPESGTPLQLGFAGPVTGTDDLAEHLTVTVDGSVYPLEQVSTSGADNSVLEIVLAGDILARTRVVVSYDGEGSLAVGGEPAPDFVRTATNNSTRELTTPWAEDVDPAEPLQEYPRPQLTRTLWKNLNGTWDFVALTAQDADLPATWDEQAVVPFPIESTLSGIGRHEDHFAYRRTFTVPSTWLVGRATKLMLNFGAVDNHAVIEVNGTRVAEHTGGYDAFSVDVTKALRKGSNELVVRVTDTTGDQARGKQSTNPSGIFYTPASGIWQTVWMEPVTAGRIESLDIAPVLSDKGDSIQITVAAPAAAAKSKVALTVKDPRGRVVAVASGAPNKQLTVKLGKTQRWTPETPDLYKIDAVLVGSNALDRVGGYTGIRSIAVEKIGGVNRIVLNGKQTFLMSTLDQGYWPDGVYTAPTDEALAWDIKQTKDFGFNTIRKHIKVEPARWYYHADRLGMLVLQDMPSAFTSRTPESTSPAVTDQWESELHAMVDAHASTTSIIGWVIFNEGWSEWDIEATARVAADVKAQDPTRLVNTHSGVNCCQSLGDTGTGDILDHHAYTGPAAPVPDETRAAMDGEHGGYSLSIPGHVWPGGSVNPYGEVASSQALTDAYVGNTSLLVGFAASQLSGSVYTQITDVEGEVNGLYTYDRRIAKMDREKVRAINLAVIAAGSGTPLEPSGDLLGSWDFDTADGTTTPGADGSPDATLSGNATLVEGVDGSALGLDGSNDTQAAAVLPTLDTTRDFSVAAWVKADTIPGAFATAVAADGLSGNSAFFLQYAGPEGGWAFSLPSGARAAAPSVPVTAGTWYHLVGVRDVSAGTLTIYVDGVQAGQVTNWTTSGTTGRATVGRAQWERNSVDGLDGAVDEVRIFASALTADEIAVLAGSS